MSATNAIDTSRLPDPGAGFVWERTAAEGRETIVLRPAVDRARAAFTTRVGGLCPPPWHSLNISFTVGTGASWERWVAANRRIAAAAVGGRGWSNVRQVHGNNVVKAVDGLHSDPADAVWTDDPRQTVAVMAADCVPILIVGERGIAAVHAGWRGVVAGVVRNAVRLVGATRAFAGPAIGPCCFEVGPDVARAFDGSARTDERHVDLWKAAENAAGGEVEFHAARVCTSCNPHLFFSHRRDRGGTGRQALVARLS